MLLGWLRDDGWISAEDAERVTQRFGAGDSAASTRWCAWAAPACVRAGSGKALDTEALTEWLAGAASCPTCASTR